MQCLFRFYSYGLETKFRSKVFADFQAEVRHLAVVVVVAAV